jgi:hypothetical protein
MNINDVVPQKTHNLVLLNDRCIETDNSFEEIKMECGFINSYLVYALLNNLIFLPDSSENL